LWHECFARFKGLRSLTIALTHKSWLMATLSCLTRQRILYAWLRVRSHMSHRCLHCALLAIGHLSHAGLHTSHQCVTAENVSKYLKVGNFWHALRAACALFQNCHRSQCGLCTIASCHTCRCLHTLNRAYSSMILNIQFNKTRFPCIPKDLLP
jgi:hypothetical protein